ncbi:MAG: thioredoxin [Helicobacteraceae bacterium]|jgi:thioredoxin 1|nr:thioredoxin [Helicobacteraceae bacterium]
MGSAVELNVSNFDEAIKEGVSLVDFWAPWCGPCRMVTPTVDELAKIYEGKVKIGKVNVDENQELAARFGVRSIPTILFFKKGEQADSIIGVQPKHFFVEKIDKLLAQGANA